LKHTYIGDLHITLVPPAATGSGPIVLHNRVGGSTRDLTRNYDAAAVPGLANLAGRSCKGVWELQISDRAAADTGILVSFGLTIAFAQPGGINRSVRVLSNQLQRESRRKKSVKSA
jgi:subtilisin-like proprotein convertase family protein